MTEPALIRDERTVVRELERLSAERAEGEQATGTFEARQRNALEERDKAVREARALEATERERATEERERIHAEVAARSEAEIRAARKELAEARWVVQTEFDTDHNKLEVSHQEARWTATTLYDASRSKAEARHKEFERKLAAQVQRLGSTQQSANDFFARWLSSVQPEPDASAAPEAPLPEDCNSQLKGFMTDAETRLAQAKRLLVLQPIRGRRFLWVQALLLALAGAPLALQPEHWLVWLGGGFAAALAGGAGLYLWLTFTARRQVAAFYAPFCRALNDAAALCFRWREQVGVAHARHLAQLQERSESDLRTADLEHQRQINELSARRDSDIASAEQRSQRKLADAQAKRDAEIRHADTSCQRRLTESDQRCQAVCRQAEERHRQADAENRRWYEHSWQATERSWHDGLAQANAVSVRVNSECAQRFPGWDEAAWREWKPPVDLPPAIRFGGFVVNLEALPQGTPQDQRLAPRGPTRFALPALVPFPDPCGMLVEASGEGRVKAEAVLQTVLFRLLTTVPPGKLRLTVIDPAGLGRSFAAFMHLADYDELLVTNRIWTEQEQIDERLADLTAHMEKVIQKYLRNQFATLEEYNALAGEVAEPYRVLVVANYPVGFGVEATRRLLSVARSGARCGVLTLVSVDSDQALPQGFDIKELARGAHLVWEDGRFVWRDRELGRFFTAPDEPPAAEFMTRVLNDVGQAAKLAKRVEVPFEFVAPPPERWWQGNSAAGVDVPLGRAGATKRQHLQLGRGTAQHVLIAGKTGSGKSTLLHGLITNASLLYSPEELELYLIDFKEGVEFKAYATLGLPHARVVAIESEREFGLSVLQRLDVELKARGDRFRQFGVQDINGYRQADGAAPLPRILLVVDEFQLFFFEDDKIAQESALLLDRLVRQGRAFGVHVLLGSQTLGGAYSLARSTIGQMAVRIALQCSESDANLILSEDNGAARLLSRPGEAIYNDANGLVEGNDFFQVVWLSDEQRAAYLRRISELASRRAYQAAQPPIVFEGNASAVIERNHLLKALLASPPPTARRERLGWLGEAVSIKDPTAAVFRPQGGSNLMLVGQNDEAALALVATTAVSLAAQATPPAGARFEFLDGTTVDSPHAGYLARLAESWPFPCRVGGWRELPQVLGELAAEVERRLEAAEPDAPEIYLFIYAMQRFRELRPQEDDFGFGRPDENKPPSPSKLFGSVIRDGPGVGVHTVFWCDNLNNLNRTLDRQGQREFEMRVLFQMSAADSSSLIDNPLASRLGMNRALFHSEDRDQPEKFRPYGLPSFEWLQRVKRDLSRQPASV